MTLDQLSKLQSRHIGFKKARALARIWPRLAFVKAGAGDTVFLFIDGDLYCSFYGNRFRKTDWNELSFGNKRLTVDGLLRGNIAVISPLDGTVSTLI